MNYENVKLWFAKNDKEQIITIDDINDQNRNGTYYCPVCGSQLKPKAVKSKQVTSHFAHIDASKCNSESQIHFWFKHKFIEKGDKFTVASDEIKEYICKDMLVEEPYETEHGVYKPDVTIFTECGNTIYFEMAFTNKKKIKDYLNMWLELKNIVVEIDIKHLTLNDKMYVFKALFYNGKCFNTKRNDTYYNIIGKYKEKLLKNDIVDEIRDRIMKLDWLWEDIYNYKKGNLSIQDISILIESIDKDDIEIVNKILSRQSCISLFEDYIGYKSKTMLSEILNHFKGHWILDKRDIYVSPPFKSHLTKCLTGEIRILNKKDKYFTAYDIFKYNTQHIISEINQIINNIVEEEKRKKDINYANNNYHLKNVINRLQKKYKQIDNNYNFSNTYYYPVTVLFNYGSHTKVEIKLIDNIVYSNNEDQIENHIKQSVDKYIYSIDKLNNKEELNKSLLDLKRYCEKIKYIDIYEERKYLGNKKVMEIKKRNINYSISYEYYSEDLLEITINRLVDNYYRYLGCIKTKIYIHKNKISLGRAVIEQSNILDKKEIKIIYSYHEDLKNIITELISLDLKCDCKDCKDEFKLEYGEIKFFVSKNMELPKRCKICRNKRKQIN